MCVYCMVSDWAHHFIPDPSWPQQPGHINPAPGHPGAPFQWNVEMLTQFNELLRRVKELEDKVGGCPCPDESKLDHLRAIRERLDSIDDTIKAQKEKK